MHQNTLLIRLNLYNSLSSKAIKNGPKPPKFGHFGREIDLFKRDQWSFPTPKQDNTIHKAPPHPQMEEMIEKGLTNES